MSRRDMINCRGEGCELRSSCGRFLEKPAPGEFFYDVAPWTYTSKRTDGAFACDVHLPLAQRAEPTGISGWLRNVVAILLAIVALGCGDNVHSAPDAAPDATVDAAVAFTWRDAWATWADAWCQYAERCYPSDFAGWWRSQPECVEYVTELNCSISVHDCAEPYPDDHRETLRSCYRDMLDVACSATREPTFCVAALEL